MYSTLFVIFFWNNKKKYYILYSISLYSPCWPQTQVPLAFASWVLRLQACTTIIFIMYIICFPAFLSMLCFSWICKQFLIK
jgi:hypothetical protein